MDMDENQPPLETPPVEAGEGFAFAAFALLDGLVGQMKAKGVLSEASLKRAFASAEGKLHQLVPTENVERAKVLLRGIRQNQKLF